MAEANTILLKKKIYGCTKPFVTTREIEESNVLYKKYKSLLFNSQAKTTLNNSTKQLPKINHIQEDITTPNIFFNEHKDDHQLNRFTEKICYPLTSKDQLVSNYKSSRNISSFFSKTSTKWKSLYAKTAFSEKANPNKAKAINDLVYACTEFNSHAKSSLQNSEKITERIKGIFNFIDSKVLTLFAKDDTIKSSPLKAVNIKKSELYWKLNIKKADLLQKLDKDLTKMLLPEELRILHNRKVKFDPFETKMIQALGKAKHYRAASHHSSYKIFMDRVIEKALQTKG